MAKEFAKAFYNSVDWQKCRSSFIASRINIDGGMCQHCQKRLGYIVDHIEEITEQNINVPMITLNHKNMQYLCLICHNKKTLMGERENRFDENGNPIETKTYIVYGSPGSGKTTYVKENIKDGDIVIDFDELRKAMTYNNIKHSKSKSIGAILQIREGIYSLIEENKVKANNIFVIAGLPNKAERMELQERLSATMIHIDTNEEECIRRVNLDTNRTDKEKERWIIKKYWDEFQK